MRKRKKPARYPCTDTGNAELIAALCGDALRYDHRQGRWLIWDKRRHRWNEDSANEVRKFAIAAARYRRRVAALLADTEKSKAEIRWAFTSEDRNKLDAALEIAKSLPPVSDTGNGWDADPWLFGVGNGVVNLRSGELRAERPGDQITKHSSVPFEADAKCPRFQQFLPEIFNSDEELVDYVQRTIGYCLTGSVREQCVFCWCGSGANGKTTLENLLRHILGEHAVNLAFSALETTHRNSNDLVALAGARLATASETNEGVRLNEARIKVLTGGDPITARRLYQESFTFSPTHKLVLAFNHKPIIADDSEGMWRRVHLVLFSRQFKPEEQDKNLLDQLKGEATGVLGWAVRGCLLWQKNGLAMPPAVKRATAAYRDESDHLGQFIGDCCTVEPSSTETSEALWRRYQSWATENEEVSLSRQVFASRLERRGFQRNRSGHRGTRVWSGIRLRQKNPGTDADTPTQADGVSENFSTRGGGESSQNPRQRPAACQQDFARRSVGENLAAPKCQIVNEVAACNAVAVPQGEEAQNQGGVTDELIPPMPPGMALVSWELKPAPVTIGAGETVTDPAKFARGCLEQLRNALANPRRRAAWTVPQLLKRVALVGVMVRTNNE
jgi:putative DNA primase/helicase